MLAIIAAALLATSPAAGDGGTVAAAGIGVGGSSCSDLSEINARDPKWAHDNYLSWAEGFMTGWNVALMDHKEPLASLNSLTHDGLWERLKSYCATHPDRTFGDAVAVTYLLLRKAP